MKRRTQVMLFVVGGGVFAWLVSRIGVAALWHDAVRTGWMFVPIVLLFSLVYLLNAAAWHVMMVDEPNHPPFWQTYAIIVSGFSINFLTPMMNMGGEPFKVAAAGAWLGQQRATGSVILYTLIHALSFFVTGFIALILALILLPHDPAVVWGAALLSAGTAVLTGLVLACLRQGALERMLDMLNRIPLVRAAARRWVEPRRALLVQLDHQIVEFYHERPKRFYQALTFECLSRALFMVEYCLIAYGVGVHMNYFTAYAIGGVSTLILNALFFVPFEVGTKEATFYLLFQMFGFDPRIGFYTSIVSRVRDFTWIGIGLALIWLTGRRSMMEKRA